MQTNSAKQEFRIATTLKTIFGHGRRQPGSGNTPTAPNDVAVVNHFHVECKTTEAKSIIVQHDWILKATKRAFSFGVPAVLALNFARIGSKDYFVISDDLFYSLLHSQCENEHLIADVRALRLKVKRLTGEKDDAYEGQLHEV